MNDYVQYSVSNTESQEAKEIVLLQSFFKSEAGTGTDFAPEYSKIDGTVPEPIQVKSECNIQAPSVYDDTPHVNTMQTGERDTLLPSPDQFDADESEDIELRNVLDLENVLTSMHGTGNALGRMAGGDNSHPLENDLERVMRLENVLRKVNGNVSEFKSVEEALRKIHENIILNDGEKNSESSEHVTYGLNQMSDIELALQSDPLILNDDFLGSFSSIEEWASSQLKQQDKTSRSLIKDELKFTLKTESEVMKSAKILFAKKTKTLFRWLHPKDSKADLRQRVDRAWDCLSPKEIEYYYSQVLGPFNHRHVKPMINPRIFELLNIPESLRPTPSTSCTDADADDSGYQHASEEPKPGKVGKARKVPKCKVPATGIPRRKRGPYKKTLQALENSTHSEKRRKRNSSSSSSSDREYSPTASRKRKREPKKKKITKMGKLRLKFCKMKTTKLPESSESDDDRDEEDDSDNLNPYKRCFERTLPADSEISVELTQGLEECEKLLDSDCSM